MVLVATASLMRLMVASAVVAGVWDWCGGYRRRGVGVVAVTTVTLGVLAVTTLGDGGVLAVAVMLCVTMAVARVVVFVVVVVVVVVHVRVLLARLATAARLLEIMEAVRLVWVWPRRWCGGWWWWGW